MRARPLAALLLACLACGNEQEEELNRHRGECNSLPPGATLEQASLRLTSYFRIVDVAGECRTNFVPLGADDACVYDGRPLCTTVFEWFTSDASLCGPFAGRTCAYWCEVRTDGPASGNLETPLCARRFLQGQPVIAPQ